MGEEVVVRWTTKLATVSCLEALFKRVSNCFAPKNARERLYIRCLSTISAGKIFSFTLRIRRWALVF